MTWLTQTSAEFWLIVALTIGAPIVAITAGRMVKFGQTRILFLAPAVIAFAIFVVYPIGGSFFLGFTNAESSSLKCSDGRSIREFNTDKRAVRNIVRDAEAAGVEPVYPADLNTNPCERVLDYEFVGFENYRNFFSKVPRDLGMLFGVENLQNLGRMFDGDATSETRFTAPKRIREPTESLFNNIIWLVLFQLAIPLGLGLAVLLNQTALFARILKPAFFFPFVLSPVVIGFLFNFFYNSHSGPLLWFYDWSGLGADGIMGTHGLATFGIIIAAWYPQIAYCSVIYLAGLTAVNPELIEAGSLDGARGIRLFRTVVLPQLWPATFICIVVTTIGALRSFDLVQVMTGGGVFSRVLAFTIYEQGFRGQQLGYSSAIAVILFLIMLVFIVFFVRRMLSQAED